MDLRNKMAKQFVISPQRTSNRKPKQFNLELWELLGRPHVHTKSKHRVVEIVVFKDVIPDSFTLAGIVETPGGRVLMTWRADGKIAAPGDGDIFSSMDLMMRIE